MDEIEDYSHVIPKNCEACEEPIPLARLDVFPNTKYCVKCVDANSPKIVRDPEEICAKSSPSGQNGFSPKS